MSPDRLGLAADQLEIIAVLSAYCHALDRRDPELLAVCFHPDSTHRHGSFQGPSQEFLRFAQDVLHNLVVTHHQISPPLIRLEGDVAHVETYFTAFHRIGADAPADAVFPGTGVAQDLVIGGRYIDRFERRDGAWRIAHRTGVHDWQRLSPASDGDFAAQPPEQRGAHGPADPAWQVPARP